MNGLYDYDDIEDYLGDRMSETDRIAFEQALETDPDLVQRVHVVKAEAKVHRMMRDEYIMNQFEAWGREAAEKKIDIVGSENTGMNAVSAHKKWLFPAIVGLGLFILIAVFFNWGNKPGKTPAAGKMEQPPVEDTTSVPPQNNEKNKDAPVAIDHSAPKNNISINTDNPDTRYVKLRNEFYVEGKFEKKLMGIGDAQNNTDPYEKAVQLYKEKKYSEALKLLMNPAKDQEPEYFYLRGYVYYHLGQYRKAEQDFHAFRGMKYSDHKIDAEWREVFCMVGQLPDARKRLEAVLEAITADPEHNYYEQALRLKEALKGK